MTRKPDAKLLQAEVVARDIRDAVDRLNHLCEKARKLGVVVEMDMDEHHSLVILEEIRLQL